jgi:hypothetical protein
LTADCGTDEKALEIFIAEFPVKGEGFMFAESIRVFDSL